MRAGRGRVLAPPRSPSPLLRPALTIRLGYLLGHADLTAADVGAALLLPLTRGPRTRAALQTTVSGFLAAHADRAAGVAAGRVGAAAQERALARDALVLAALGELSWASDASRTRLAEPARRGLTTQRLLAVVDPADVVDLLALLELAEQRLWRPLATAAPAPPSPLARVLRIGDTLVGIDTTAARRPDRGVLSEVRLAAALTGDVARVAVYSARFGALVIAPAGEVLAAVDRHQLVEEMTR